VLSTPSVTIKIIKESAMMTYRRILMLCITIMIVFSFGCASTPTQEGTGEYIDDSAITAKVKTAILQEASLKSAEINVETFKGVVQLSGFVSLPSSVGTAGEVAKRVRGVKAVRNDIRIKGQQ
jgi:osmotically-inducible protein OsmY